jgi:microcystin-dependent protein
MAYTKHTWYELTGTGAQKATWMNNMETQYDEVVSYYTTTLHDASYYTETECVTIPFYNPGQDGAGSGFVAETLDGYTATTIINSQVPAGTVTIWANSQASIPAGWHLCDGRDIHTPDLRGRFPVAAGGTYNLDDTGGAATQSSTAASITIATHALTQYEMPSHTHAGITDTLDNITAGQRASGGIPNTDVSTAVWTSSAGSDTAHGHPGSTMAGGQGTTGNNLPKYKAYCYIVKE